MLQINTCVEDPLKSIEHLIKAGTEQAKAKESGGHYQRNKGGKLPASISVRPTKSRGSSVGHSREGSSDDGFGSSGRQTLSPSSISANTVNGFHPYNVPNVSHSRQASAPALINYGAMEQPQTSSSRMVPGLPTVAHGHSRSLNTVSTSPVLQGSLSNTGSAYNIAQPIQSPELTAPMQPSHGASKSLDLETVNYNNLALKHEPYEVAHPGYSQAPNQMQHGYFQPMHGKSASLDPMTFAQMHSSGSSPQAMGMTSPIACSSDDPDDGLGSLPKGWSKSYCSEVNRAYFIDHINKTTTWIDPRIPKEMQENLRDRAMISQSGDQRQQQYYLPQHQGQGQQQPRSYQQEYPQTSLDRVSQLQMERNNMLERQQQLCREGLLPPQQASHAAMYGNPQMSQYPNGYEMHHHQNQHPRQYPPQSSDAMEVDFNNQSMHNTSIDPAFVQDLNLNPAEFDKYLYINDRKPQQPQHIPARYN